MSEQQAKACALLVGAAVGLLLTGLAANTLARSCNRVFLNHPFTFHSEEWKEYCRISNDVVVD
jgi:hypothetical protein